MSQFFLSSSNSTPPPQVPTSFPTDSGTATPAANVLNIFGGDTTANNDNGLTTTGSGNTVTVLLTNRATGTGSTSGAASANLITLALGSTPGVYTFDISIAGFDSTTPAGCGFTIVGAIRTTGAAATLITNQQVDHFEEAALLGVVAVLSSSGNNALVTVTGIAGKTISWNATLNYTFVS